MDFLAGYGSGSESEDDVPAPATTTAVNRILAAPVSNGQAAAAAPPKAGCLLSSLPKPSSTAVETSGLAGLPPGFFDADASEARGTSQPAPQGVPAGFFDSPAAAAVAPQPLQGSSSPSTEQGTATQLFSKLPAASKRKVLLRPQIDLQLLAQQSDSDDDEPVAKKLKAAAAPAAGGKPSILSFLPAPKNAAGKRMDVGDADAGDGGGFAAAAQLRQQQRQQQEQAAAPAAAVGGDQAPDSNEAYRLRPAAAAAAAAADAADSDHYYRTRRLGYEHAGQHSYTADQVDTRHHQRQQQQQQLAPEEAFLQEALQAEASKAARRAAGAGSAQLVLPDIQFKEVKADEVKYVDPAQREATQGMRSALGSDYAQQLRSQAAPHVGSKLARSKHQIGTLFANAKLRELEVMENRAGGMKSKAETAGKYGW